MSYMIRKVYRGVVYKADSLQFHPVISLLVLLIQFILMVSNSFWELYLATLIVLLENFILKNRKGSLSLIRAILPFLLIIGLLTFVFSGLESSLLIVGRFINGSLIFSLFFAITNPSDLSRSLENLHVPQRLAIIPSLSLTMVPRVAKDAEETFEALYFRGEISGRYFRWLPRVLAILIASVLYRSEFLAQSLYFRGFNLKSRTHYRNVPIHYFDIIRLLFWIVVLLISVYYDLGGLNLG
ncbi:MAG: energy-coupling factor transporter transmembrane component T family protein [Candidatus Hodarchaeales archaeon]